MSSLSELLVTVTYTASQSRCRCQGNLLGTLVVIAPERASTTRTAATLTRCQKPQTTGARASKAARARVKGRTRVRTPTRAPTRGSEGAHTTTNNSVKTKTRMWVEPPKRHTCTRLHISATQNTGLRPLASHPRPRSLVLMSSISCQSPC